MLETVDVAEGGWRRIKNAATRIGRPIYLVGSRASGMYNSASDFDYVISNIRSKDWKKIKNSLPGAKQLQNNLPNRIDLFKGEVDLNLPYIKIDP